MPKVRATLPERYALTMTVGLGIDIMLFMLTSMLLVGIILRGSADVLTWFLLIAFWVISVIFGVLLGIIYHHDRELIRKPQEYRGELA